MWIIAEQWRFMHAQSCRGLGNSYTELALCLNLSVNYNADLWSDNFSTLVISSIVYITTTFCVVPHLSEGYHFNVSWPMYWGLFRPPMYKSILCTCWAFCLWCVILSCHTFSRTNLMFVVSKYILPLSCQDLSLKIAICLKLDGSISRNCMFCVWMFSVYVCK
jgi:hypothetical protein